MLLSPQNKIILLNQCSVLHGEVHDFCRVQFKDHLYNPPLSKVCYGSCPLKPSSLSYISSHIAQAGTTKSNKATNSIYLSLMPLMYDMKQRARNGSSRWWSTSETAYL